VVVILLSPAMVNERDPVETWLLNSKKASPEEATALRELEVRRPVDGSWVKTAALPDPKNGMLM